MSIKLHDSVHYVTGRQDDALYASIAGEYICISKAKANEGYTMYNEQFVQPIRKDLVDAGFVELRSADEVRSAFSGRKGPLICVVNSICGCAAAAARPGVKMAIEQVDSAYRPKHLTTVFAGQDAEATAAAREYFTGYPPSSPSVALLVDGEIQFLLPRHEIEGSSSEEIARKLVAAFEEHFDQA